MDADHLDIYGAKEELESTFKSFVAQLKEGGCLISRKDLPIESEKKHIKYSAHEDADFCISDLQVEAGEFLFTIQAGNDQFEDVHFGMPGRHNVENMLAAIAVASELGIDKESIIKAVASYKGVKRRFDVKYKGDQFIYIDDYAHHPEELRACISAVRELYPGKRVSGIFQPHLFSRTQDFANEFARSLEMLDDVVLLEIYPARELPIEGVNSKMLLNLINKDSKFLWTKDEVIRRIGEFGADVYLTLGAGDIDTLVEPLSNNFKAGKYEKNS
jgi:UDP-N-acetylmuramate--alanine ligase